LLYAIIDEIKNAEIAKLKEAIETLEGRLGESKRWYSVKRVLAETGKQYDEKPLEEYCRIHRYIVEKAFDNDSGKVNTYHINVWKEVYGLELRTGQAWTVRPPLQNARV
jgi:hypothetical protein